MLLTLLYLVLMLWSMAGIAYVLDLHWTLCANRKAYYFLMQETLVLATPPPWKRVVYVKYVPSRGSRAHIKRYAL